MSALEKQYEKKHRRKKRTDLNPEHIIKKKTTDTMPQLEREPSRRLTHTVDQKAFIVENQK